MVCGAIVCGRCSRRSGSAGAGSGTDAHYALLLPWQQVAAAARPHGPAAKPLSLIATLLGCEIFNL